MADIRQSTAVKDNFNRANEIPLAPPWEALDTGIWSEEDLRSNSITHGTGTSSMSYWSTENFNGDDAEAWATSIGGNANGTAWGIGLFSTVGGSNTVDGYRFRCEIGIGAIYRLERWDNGSPVTLDTFDPGHSGGPRPMLIRRNGSDVEGWVTTSGTDTSAWTLFVSATDTNYTSGLYLALGNTDNGGTRLTGWDDFGGGTITFVPQIYRRPNE
jgi:hypothetical protein